MAEMIWRIGFDQNEAKQAGKKAGQEQAKQVEKGRGPEAAAGGFAGGLIGSLLGELLTSVKTLIDPITSIASLLVIALFPIFKPFLILFIKVGLLLYKWLNRIVGQTVERGGIGDIAFDVSEVEGEFKSSTSGVIDMLNNLKSVGDALTTSILGVSQSIVSAFLQLIGDFSLFIAGTLDEIFGTNLGEGVTRLFEGIFNIVNGWFKIVGGILTFDWDSIKEGFMQIIGGIIQVSEGVFAILLGGFGVLFKSVLSILRVIFKGLWEELKEIISNSIDTLKDIGTWMFNKLKEIFTSAFSVLKDIGIFIRNKIKSFISIGSGRSSSVNDAIITPNGDVIRTNPSDYLIATKTPGNLGGTGSSNVNVTINGGLITEDVARDIGRIITRQLNLGGNF